MKKDRKEKLIIHRWQAEDIQNALRQLNNYEHFSKATSCADRDLIGAMNTIQNILNNNPNSVASRFKIDTDYSPED